MRNASDTAPATVPAGTGSPTVVRVIRGIQVLAVVAAGIAVLVFPQTGPTPFIMSVGVVILSYACMATGWNFVGGFTGYISLGHAAFTGLGGYGVGLLILRADVQPWIALVLAALVVALISIPIGFASLRVRGASFVIMSLALVLIMLLVFQSWSDVTGGSNGLRVPRPFGPEVLRPEQHERFYYLHVILLLIMLLAWWAIDRSRFGAGLKAIREDEDKAQSLGIPTFNYKLAVYVISAFFTALAGGLYALWFGFLDPIFQFSILTGSYMVLMSLLGGIRSLFGPALGALIVGYAIEFFKAQYGDTQFHLVALGLLLGLVVLFMPEGILPSLGRLLDRLRPSATSIREESAEDLANQRAATEELTAEESAPSDDASILIDENGRPS